MPNNLVFNDIASELKVQMYGSNGMDLQLVSVSADGGLAMDGTVTLSGGTIDVLTAGTVSVSGGTIDTVSALTAGTVSVSGGTIDALTAGTVKTFSLFTTDTTTSFAVGTSTVSTLVENTSTQKVYSFYVANVAGAFIITAWLQVAPAAGDTYYTNDSATQYTIAPSGKAVLVPSKFLNYTRLQMIATGASASALCIYQAQS